MLERIITGVVLIAIVLLCMFAFSSAVPMLILMLLTALGAGYEWAKLMPQDNSDMQNNDLNATPISNPEEKIGLAWVYGLFNFVFVILSYFYFRDIWILFWLASVAVWCVSLYWIKRYPHHDGWYTKGLYALGVLLIVATVTAIVYLQRISPWWLMYVFVLVWGADSGAYFVGRKFGRTPLAPTVSPKKSIEGLIGGVLLSVVVIFAVAMWLKLTSMALFSFLILSILTVFSSVLGDLLESMIKRRAGIKDSGHILPGHGGILDRIDSLLAAAPVFAAGMYLFDVLGLRV